MNEWMKIFIARSKADDQIPRFSFVDLDILFNIYVYSSRRQNTIKIQTNRQTDWDFDWRLVSQSTAETEKWEMNDNVLRSACSVITQLVTIYSLQEICCLMKASYWTLDIVFLLSELRHSQAKYFISRFAYGDSYERPHIVLKRVLGLPIQQSVCPSVCLLCAGIGLL